MDTRTSIEAKQKVGGGERPKVLVVDDNELDRLLTSRLVEKEGFEATTADDGGAALEMLGRPSPPGIVLLDWEMPGLDGPSVCRQLREKAGVPYVYMIMVTARGNGLDQVAGRDAGADDYIVKPFLPAELRSKLGVARRIVALERKLWERVAELETALAHVQKLEALLPICMWCKRIRDENESWQSLESHITRRTGSLFTHGLCEECCREHYPEVSS